MSKCDDCSQYDKENDECLIPLRAPCPYEPLETEVWTPEEKDEEEECSFPRGKEDEDGKGQKDASL